ncbi:hypothetical protein FM071_01750 [Sulfurimonas paralvinellae]|uniref:Uncharacterized protein n=1 Tax=Sulfurimonas paralvinellae TaxID=317658 RepID=A0A7M1BAE6_9BACT|nr:hypothetical protein FM071_01750 [Sulfurimonas paralvinellae]
MNIIIFYIVLELYEVQWQKAETIMGMLARMYRWYQKSIFLFLIMHPTFYFAVWFVLQTNYNPYAVALLLFKSADIITKIVLIKKVFIDKELSREFTLSLFTPIGPYMPYVGILLYPFFIYMALS